MVPMRAGNIANQITLEDMTMNRNDNSHSSEQGLLCRVKSLKPPNAGERQIFDFETSIREYSEKAFFLFCQGDRPDLLEKYLKEVSSVELNVNQIIDGSTAPLPLCDAIVYEALECVNFLIDKGAKLDAACEVYGCTPLDLMKEKGMRQDNGFVFIKEKYYGDGLTYEDFITSCRYDLLDSAEHCVENGCRYANLYSLYFYGLHPSLRKNPLFRILLRNNSKKVLKYLATIPYYREGMAKYAEIFKSRRLREMLSQTKINEKSTSRAKEKKVKEWKEEQLLFPDDLSSHSKYGHTCTLQEFDDEMPAVAMLECCKYNRPDLIDEFLAKYPDFDLNENQTVYGQTLPLPLFASIAYDALGSANYLVSSGAKLDSICKVYGRSLLQLLEQKGCGLDNNFIYKKRDGSRRSKEYDCKELGIFEFRSACCEGHLEMVKRHLENGGCPWNIKDGFLYSMPPGFYQKPLLELLLFHNVKNILSYLATIPYYRTQMEEYASRFKSRRLMEVLGSEA